jgi:hypothetical protein
MNHFLFLSFILHLQGRYLVQYQQAVSCEKCNRCEKLFKQKDGLQDHISEIHTKLEAIEDDPSHLLNPIFSYGFEILHGPK